MIRLKALRCQLRYCLCVVRWCVRVRCELAQKKPPALAEERAAAALSRLKGRGVRVHSRPAQALRHSGVKCLKEATLASACVMWPTCHSLRPIDRSSRP